MEKIFLAAAVTSAVYIAMTLVECKFLKKEFKPVKEMIREGFFVFLSALFGLFIFFKMSGSFTDFFNVITETKSEDLKSTQVFTGEPEF